MKNNTIDGEMYVYGIIRKIHDADYSLDVQTEKLGMLNIKVNKETLDINIFNERKDREHVFMCLAKFCVKTGERCDLLIIDYVK